MAGQPLHRKRRFFEHNILMGGPPAAGKTLLARAVPSILPRMTFDESLTVTIADLAKATPVAHDSIETAHLAEAIQYRPRREM